MTDPADSAALKGGYALPRSATNDVQPERESFVSSRRIKETLTAAAALTAVAITGGGVAAEVVISQHTSEQAAPGYEPHQSSQAAPGYWQFE